MSCKKCSNSAINYNCLFHNCITFKPATTQLYYYPLEVYFTYFYCIKTKYTQPNALSFTLWSPLLKDCIAFKIWYITIIFPCYHKNNNNSFTCLFDIKIHLKSVVMYLNTKYKICRVKNTKNEIPFTYVNSVAIL